MCYYVPIMIENRIKPSEAFPSWADFDRIERLKILDAKSADVFELSLVDNTPLGTVQRIFLRGFVDYHAMTVDQLQSLDPSSIPEFTIGASQYLRRSAVLSNPQIRTILSGKLTFDSESGEIRPSWLQTLLDDISSCPTRRRAEDVLKDIDVGLSAFAKTE